MAANKRMFRVVQCFYLVFLLSVTFFQPTNQSTTEPTSTVDSTSNETTTPDPATILSTSNDTATTENATQQVQTEISTTTQPTTTTTPPPVTFPPSQVPSNTDLAYCPCDLTGNACDINCCCDEECTSDDRLAFSECQTNSVPVDDRLCYPDDVIMFYNNKQLSGNTSNSLFCIYYDNNKERNYYTAPDVIGRHSEFLAYQQKYTSKPSFQAQPEPKTIYPDFYKSGDAVYIVFATKTQGYLSLPTSSPMGSCLEKNPVAYLKDQTSVCVQSAATAEALCSEASINAQRYYQNFKVVTTPKLFQNFNNTCYTSFTPAAGTQTDIYNNDCVVSINPTTHLCQDALGLIGDCSFTDTPAPSLSADKLTCQNVVKQVAYTFKTNGVDGVVSVSVQFIFADITAEYLPLSQICKTIFESSQQQNDTVHKSGNPGYRIGEPILAGRLNSYKDLEGNEKQHIILNKDRNSMLTIVRGSATGDCLTDTYDDRIPVAFGQSMKSGCLIRAQWEEEWGFDIDRLRLDDKKFSMNNMTDLCETAQTSVLLALEGNQTLVSDYAGTFGNSDASAVGDWIPILRPSVPSPALFQNTREGPCCNMITGVHLRILYANVGSLANPQPKLIGVSYAYDQQRDVCFLCSGPYCLPGAEQLTQAFEISTSVSFTDVSVPAVGEEGEPPIFLAKIPRDFFYPFGTDASSRNSHCLSIEIFLILLVLLCL